METMKITVFGEDTVKSGRYLLPPYQVEDGDSWFVPRYTASHPTNTIRMILFMEIYIV
jgi:hypothetical protein